MKGNKILKAQADTPLQRHYAESRFGGFSDVDGTVAFYTRIQALLSPKSVVLDVGCGRGAGLQNDPVPYRRELRALRGRCARVIGIDVDPDAASHTGLDEFHHLYQSGEWPVADSSIDLIVSDFVLEHVDDPKGYFAEVARVLKPGGLYCARTSNRIGYVGLAASLVPNRRHVQVLNRVQSDRAEVDVFPTRYRVNTVWSIRRTLRRAGLDGIAYGYEAEPSYLGFADWAYKLGKILHSITPGPLRTCLFVFARKPLNAEI
ncbi:MAG: class I SAM-dependent methyltransferase [Chromatiaceae bacterium]|nr:class I SAM-dependent methyltransferase [Chromatiaceae bacterium]MCF8002794.1 class I SAM-dependent methyltransferase [Chromatiaceae bacterium]